MENLVNNLGFGIGIIKDKMKNKLRENDGVSLSKENLIWIIIVLIVGSLFIVFLQKFFPEILDLVGDKIKGFFGQIKI